jgi:hypothetical protein
MSYGIRPAPGVCCPEKDCDYTTWDGITCRSCGADCSQCRYGRRKKDV